MKINAIAVIINSGWIIFLILEFVSTSGSSDAPIPTKKNNNVAVVFIGKWFCIK